MPSIVETEDEIYRKKLAAMVKDLAHDDPAAIALCFRESIIFQSELMAELFKVEAPMALIDAIAKSISALSQVEIEAEAAFPEVGAKSVSTAG